MRIYPKCYHCRAALRPMSASYTLSANIHEPIYARHDTCEHWAKFVERQANLHKLYCHLENCPFAISNPVTKRYSRIGTPKDQL